MQENDYSFIGVKFREYYSKNPIFPARIREREFGFGFQGKIDLRHKAFNSQSDFEAYMRSEGPLYASYSTAWYRFPSARPMQKKEFLGSELVFDFDTPQGVKEHEHNEILCSKCLEKLRNDALLLTEEFLLGDLGFSESEVKINYSGSKGFHVHAENEAYSQLDSEARKQILAFVSGKVSIEDLLQKKFITKKNFVMRGPNEKSRGWAKKVYLEARNFIQESTLDSLQASGIRKGIASQIMENQELILKKLGEGNWDVLKGMEVVWDSLLKNAIQVKGLSVDKAVTFDMSRLIRLPDSLHGDTGFKAKNIELKKLCEFNPLTDAVVLGEELVKVKVLDNAKLKLKDNEIELVKEQEIQLPCYAAVLFIRKGKAVLLQ